MQKEKAVEISLNGHYLCRQRPTLPHTFACSTIGPAGLNFRVRDGNGWYPRGKITDNLEAFLRASGPAAEILSARRPGPQTPKCKDLEDNTSQLNRLGVAPAKSRALLLQDGASGHPFADQATPGCLVWRATRFGGWRRVLADAPGKFYGQAERAISTGKLRALPRFHLQPINQVIFLGPSYPACAGLGDLILGSASRLYAFSVYHHRTSLPSRAMGMTAGTQEVRPSRSSRTKDRPPQISYAHIR